MEYLKQPFSFRSKRHLYLVVLVVVFYVSANIFYVSYKNHKFYAFANKDNGSQSQNKKSFPGSFYSDEILIKLKKGSGELSVSDAKKTGKKSIDDINKDLDVIGIEKVEVKGTKKSNDDLSRWYKLKLNKPRKLISGTAADLSKDNEAKDLQKAVEKLKQDQNLETAEPNFVFESNQSSTESAEINATSSATPAASPAPNLNVSTADPNDPYYASSGSWGQAYDDLYGIKKISSAGAWQETTGSSSVVVAVIDTGVDYNHLDIESNMWVNPGEVAGDGQDNDGNGYIDDVRGWNFKGVNNNVMDDNGHGTHVAGTIGAVGNNGLGVVGVNWNVKIMPVKFLGSTGSGTAVDAAGSIIYAVNNGAKVLNNSWGGSFKSAIIADAIKYAKDNGLIIFAAAGNSEADTDLFYPSSDPNVITVGASDSSDNKAEFSNWGYKIAVLAPGVDILSLKAAQNPCTGKIIGENYCRLSGTSMAAPHAAGVAALVLSQKPNLVNEEVRQILEVSTDDTGAGGFDILTGFGRVNAQKALSVESVLQVGLEPFGGVNSSESLEIRGFAFGDSFANYELSYSTDWVNWTSIGGVITSEVTQGTLGNLDVSGLDNGLYHIRLNATNSSGKNFQAYAEFNQEKWVYRVGTLDIVSNIDPEFSYVYSDHSINYVNSIYSTNFLTGNVELLSSSPGGDFGPAVSGNKIAFVRYCEAGPDCSGDKAFSNIMVFDASTGTTTQITDNLNYKWHVDIWGDKVVWEEKINGELDIFVYDLGTNSQRQLTNDSVDQFSPKIWDDKVVWIDKRNFVNPPKHAYDLYMYDLNANTETRLTSDSSFDPSNFEFSDNMVVWDEERNTNRDVYLLDLGTNTLRQITNDPNTHSFYPTISGNQVAWAEGPRSNLYFASDVYMMDLETGQKTRITSYPEGRKSELKFLGSRLFWLDHRFLSIYSQPSLPGIQVYSPPLDSDSDGDSVSDTGDNCSSLYNPGQLNSDFNAWGNGDVAGDDRSVANSDLNGDICDSDDDNDGITDNNDGQTLANCGSFSGQAANHPNPSSLDRTNADGNGPSWDSDNDQVVDGVECTVGTNPRVASSSDRTACKNYVAGTLGLSASGDSDGDGLQNSWEFCKWGTSATNQDTDNDSIGDCREALDFDGNNVVDDVDRANVAKARFGQIKGDWSFDINGNGALEDVDRILMERYVANILPCL